MLGHLRLDRLGEVVADGQAPGNQDAEQRRDPDEMLDEEAIERFGRDLDDADVAARAVAEEQEDEDDDTADAAASPLATPF